MLVSIGLYGVNLLYNYYLARGGYDPIADAEGPPIDSKIKRSGAPSYGLVPKTRGCDGQRSRRRGSRYRCLEASASQLRGTRSETVAGAFLPVSLGGQRVVDERASQDPGRGDRVTGPEAEARYAREMPEAYGLFQQPWWLDAVAPNAWDEVRVEHHGKIHARLPFMIKRKLANGPYPAAAYSVSRAMLRLPEDGKYITRLTEEKELMSELIASSAAARRMSNAVRQR